MSWDAGDPVIADDFTSLEAAIADRWESYESHLGYRVQLTYFYMSEADARSCVLIGSLTAAATKLKSDTHPAEAPEICIDNGYSWFIAIASGSSESNIDVVSWGRAIREDDEDEDDNNNEDNNNNNNNDDDNDDEE